MRLRFRRKKRRIQYYYDYNPYNKVRAWHAVFKVAAVILVLAGFVVLAVWLDAKRLARIVGPSEPTREVQSFYDVPSKTFKTKFFEIETPESWVFEEKGSGPNKFVYHNTRSGLVRGFITVYVDQEPTPNNKQATRLLPVELGSDGFLKPDEHATQHCNKTASGKDKVGEQAVTLNGINFICDNDSTLFTVSVALKGGTPQMTMNGIDGKPATYVIYYQDSSANPTDLDFVQVMKTFKVL